MVWNPFYVNGTSIHDVRDGDGVPVAVFPRNGRIASTAALADRVCAFLNEDHNARQPKPPVRQPLNVDAG